MFLLFQEFLVKSAKHLNILIETQKYQLYNVEILLQFYQ